MILPSCFVIKCIEYAERGWAQAQREPEWGRRLLICHLKTLLQEGGDLFFFTGLRLEANKQTEFQHFKSPFCISNLLLSKIDGSKHRLRWLFLLLARTPYL